MGSGGRSEDTCVALAIRLPQERLQELELPRDPSQGKEKPKACSQTEEEHLRR